jgi:hypothetical protein
MISQLPNRSSIILGHTYQLASLLHIRSLQPSHDRCPYTHIPHDVDETLSNGVTPNNPAKDVDKDGGDFGITGDQLKGRLDGGRGRTATNIEEVGRAPTIEFDDVHRGHRETGTID